MSRWRTYLERLFENGQARLDTLGARWQVHANRRTILTVIFAGAMALTFYVSAVQAPDNFPIGELVNVPEGSSLAETAQSFERQGVVRSGLTLELIMRFTGHEGDVHAGDYLFRKPEDVFTVARAIAEGNYGLEPIRIRIPEGATTKEMTKIFAGYLQRFDKEKFLEAAQPQEGFLFPDTYFFMPNATEETVLTAMRQNFDTHVRLIGQEIVAFGKPLEEVVIMASLLEREAFNTEDRRKIAGVLWNRLNRNMLLQVDAAFAYTLGKGSFDLTVKDLTNKNDLYNTYVHKGLPPGAIGSPSMDSLLAAVTPIKHGYFFYLADKDHVTHYSKTYEEHLQLKKKYIGN